MPGVIDVGWLCDCVVSMEKLAMLIPVDDPDLRLGRVRVYLCRAHPLGAMDFFDELRFHVLRLPWMETLSSLDELVYLRLLWIPSDQ